MTDGQLTEVTGLWWLPEDPDSTIGGTLKIDEQRRIELRLIGSFRDSSGSTREDLQIPIILGVGEGKLVTLAHCMETSSNIAFPGIRSSVFQVDTALIGAHVTAPESLLFDVLYARPEHIEAWLRTPGPLQDLQMIENRLQAATLTYVRPDSIEFQLDGGLLSVVFGCTIDGPRLERRLAARAGLELKPHDPISLDLFHSEYLVPALNLIALAAGRGIRLRELQGKLAAQSGVEGNKEVRVIPQGFPWAETEESDEAKMLFTARDLGDDLPQRVQHWYRRSAELGSVFNLYFATLFGADMYSEHRFLTLAQAVETYHRLTSEGLILAKPAFKQLRRRLCLSIDIAGAGGGGKGHESQAGLFE